MPTDALLRWRSERSAALDSLEAVHARVTGKKPGRQHATEHLNSALFLRLAAEFQGFCRDLHTDAVLAIVADPSHVPGSDVRRRIFMSSLRRNRKLDVGNASPSNIGNDFLYLGLTLWADVRARYPTRGPGWNATLEDLNAVRNAIAHSDEAKLVVVRARHPLTLRTYRTWRSSLNAAATGFDNVVRAYLQDLTANVNAGGQNHGAA